MFNTYVYRHIHKCMQHILKCNQAKTNLVVQLEIYET